MMKKFALSLALMGLVAFGGAAFAEIGTIDDVPAATLLLPYFEVDLGNPNGITTLFSINNASAVAHLAHVTLWTDESIPTLDFDVFLTGYDVQTINVRDIFNGALPRTADTGIDPDSPGPTATAISNQGLLSLPDVNTVFVGGDSDFPGSTGPCANPYPGTGTLSSALIDHIRKSHTGQSSALYGGCSGANYGDNIARGYITVDSVNACNLSFPSDAGYFTTLANNRNVLWGDYFYVDVANNFASGETLVHIEACSATTPPYIGFVGNGAGWCPFDPSPAGANDYTFYGRYFAVAGPDQREPLASTFAVRYLNGGAFDGGTDLIVWRDSKTTPTGINGTHSCATTVAWFPLNQTDAVAFDEVENPQDLCFRGDNVSPPTGGSDTCFPLETQRIHVGGGNVIASDMGVTATFGWLYLNLNTSTLSVGGRYEGRAQAWVEAEMKAQGRFEVGFDAIQLDNLAASTAAYTGVVLMP